MTRPFCRRTLLKGLGIACGSGNSGNAHNHDDLPILVAGKGCGTIQTGRHTRFAKETPLNNLWVSILDRMNIKVNGLKVNGLGDSIGSLKELAG